MRANLPTGFFRPWRQLALLGLGVLGSSGYSAWLDFNGQILGESKQVNHLDWIDIEGFQLGGRLKSLEPGKLGLTKQLDRASPKLLLACAQGTRFAKATLDLDFPPAVSGLPPTRIELEDVFVTSKSISSNSDERPLESVELTFGRIVYTYVEDGNGKKAVTNYDFRQLTGSEGAGVNTDTDSDGLPDAWESAHGLSVGVNDANADSDGDGLTNFQEFQLGTLPNSATSVFKAALAPVEGAAGTFQISWVSVVGKTYLVEWTPDLATPFTTLRTVTATATTSTENIVNTGSLGFYRVRPQ